MTSTTLLSQSLTTRCGVAAVSRGAARRTVAAVSSSASSKTRTIAPFRRSSSASSSSVVVRASSDSDDQKTEGEEGAEWDVGDFGGDPDWDGNDGPFIRPEGSPFFSSYTDPTVWRLMQETLRAGEIEQILPAKVWAAGLHFTHTHAPRC